MMTSREMWNKDLGGLLFGRGDEGASLRMRGGSNPVHDSWTGWLNCHGRVGKEWFPVDNPSLNDPSG